MSMAWMDENAGEPRRIIVEGEIGAGKTHLAKELAELLGYCLLKEPVEENPFLELFYKNKKRWGFSMQVHMLHTRLGMEKAGTYMVNSMMVPGVVADRSLGGDTVFLEVNHLLGNICDEERALYLNLYETMKITCPYPDVVIYLDVDTNVLRNRIKERGRTFEQELRDPHNNYLELLKEAYGRFCAAMRRHTMVLCLDWNEFHPTEDVWLRVMESWEHEQKGRFHKRLMRW